MSVCARVREMQTRRRTQGSLEDAGAKSEAVSKPKRAPKKPRLLPSAAVPKPHPQWKVPDCTPGSPSRKRKTPSSTLRRKSFSRASNSLRSDKGLESTAPSHDKAKAHEESGKKEMEDKISINRAPVLTLWVAVVATREGYTYEEGLSFGKAIAGLMAQSKGRSLGIYEQPAEEKREERKRERKEYEKLPVFGMNVPAHTTQDGHRLALESGKQVSPASVASYLHRSFGANLERAKGAMEDLANSFSPEEIGGAAYSLYEKFRPAVSYGVKGWGAKGFLDLKYMRSLQNTS